MSADRRRTPPAGRQLTGRLEIRRGMEQRLVPLPTAASNCRCRRARRRPLSVPAQLQRQPGFGGPPVPLHRRFGQLQQRGGLGNVQTAEIAALDDLRLPRADAGQRLECRVEGEQVAAPSPRPDGWIRQT